MQNLNHLINKCIDNDRKAQKALYEQYFQFLMSVCYRYENNQQDVVALLNQSFLKIITHLKSFDQSKPFLPWIKRIAVNEAIDHLRKKKRINGQVVFLEEDEWEREINISEEDISELSDLQYEDYLEMMENLDEPCKTIFNLYAIDELRHIEIADLLGISERTSKRHLSRAREKLKNMITAKKRILKGAWWRKTT